MTTNEPLATLSFNIVTLNTHKGFTPFNRRFVLHELREAVVATGADIVFLQEVIGENELHSTRYENWPARPQYEFLAESIWSDFAYGRNAIYPAGHHGNAVLSKFPIVAWRNHDVSVSKHEQRGLLHCRMKLPGSHRDDIHAICVHLALRGADRARQLDLLCALVQDVVPPGAPLIVAGDFNDWRIKAHEVLRNCVGLREAFVETHGRAARTFPARWPLLRLDRIYLRNLHLRGSRVHALRPWSHLSDHAALFAEVSL